MLPLIGRLSEERLGANLERRCQPLRHPTSGHLFRSFLAISTKFLY